VKIVMLDEAQASTLDRMNWSR